MASFYNVLARSINGEIYRQWAKSLTHRRPLEFHLLAREGKERRSGRNWAQRNCKSFPRSLRSLPPFLIHVHAFCEKRFNAGIKRIVKREKAGYISRRGGGAILDGSPTRLPGPIPRVNDECLGRRSSRLWGSRIAEEISKSFAHLTEATARDFTVNIWRVRFFTFGECGRWLFEKVVSTTYESSLRKFFFLKISSRPSDVQKRRMEKEGRWEGRRWKYFY